MIVRLKLNLLIFKFYGKPFFFFFFTFYFNYILGMFYLFIYFDLRSVSSFTMAFKSTFFFFFGYDLGYLLLFAPLKKPLFIFCNQTKPILLILIYYYLLYYIMEILWNWRLEWYLIFFLSIFLLRCI